MSTIPRWSDSEQTDLLELVALGTPQGDADAEWRLFVSALEASVDNGLIRPNSLRPRVRGHVAPKRLGAFVSRAIAQKLIEPNGDWEISDDREGKNAGRPARCYVWIGGDAA